MAWNDLTLFEKSALIGVSPFIVVAGILTGLSAIVAAAVGGVFWIDKLWCKFRRPSTARRGRGGGENG